MEGDSHPVRADRGQGLTGFEAILSWVQTGHVKRNNRMREVAVTKRGMEIRPGRRRPGAVTPALKLDAAQPWSVCQVLSPELSDSIICKKEQKQMKSTRLAH